MDKNEIILYESADRAVKLNVTTDRDTVWLNRAQLTDLFDRDRSTISRHIRNVFKEGEPEQKAAVVKFAAVQTEGECEVARDIEYCGIDVISSVGCRVKSQRGVEFRKWANSVLKDYRGYAVNNKMIAFVLIIFLCLFALPVRANADMRFDMKKYNDGEEPCTIEFNSNEHNNFIGSVAVSEKDMIAVVYDDNIINIYNEDLKFMYAIWTHHSKGECRIEWVGDDLYIYCRSSLYFYCVVVHGEDQAEYYEIEDTSHNRELFNSIDSSNRSFVYDYNIEDGHVYRVSNETGEEETVTKRSYFDPALFLLPVVIPGCIYMFKHRKDYSSKDTEQLPPEKSGSQAK